MAEIIRNMFRRRARTFLTVFGIVIGIFALSVLGSLAEKMNVMMDGGVKYFTGQLTVSPKGSQMMGILSADVIDKLKKVDGVKSVNGQIMMMLSDDPSAMTIGIPPMIIGIDLENPFENRNYKTLAMKEGRTIRKGDKNKAMIGIDLAKQERLKVGDTFVIRKRPFKVVGILDKTLTAPDKMAMIPLPDARSMFIDSQPFLKDLQEQARQIPPAFMMFIPEKQRAQLESMSAFSPENLITGASINWEDGVDPNVLAEKINEEVEGVTVMAPDDMKKQLQQAMMIFNLIITGSALIALIVGGLSVINTMTMAVSERTKEIGLKKALGAQTSDIMKEYLAESGAIGLFGGLIGVGLGYFFTTILNVQMAAKGADIFMTTPRLVLISLAFAIILGTLSGIYPALRAANLDCVKALKEE